MKRLLPWIALGCISILLLMYFLTNYTPQQAGDIANYLGVTESVKNHFSPELRDSDKNNLITLVHPAYFDNPIYYNVPSPSGLRYSMHFIAYSYIITPVRIALEALGYNPLLVFPIANSVLLILTLSFLCASLREYKQRLILFVLVLLSPLISFLSWPGPDAWVLCLLLLAAYLYSVKRYWPAAYITAFASWHSQPLLALSAGMAFMATATIWKGIILHKNKSHFSLQSTITASIWLMGILSVPYIYNYWAFGVLTPWTKLRDGWTLLYGFGIQNLRVEKLFSQLFDINTGIFWYIPMGIIAWMIVAIWSFKKVRIPTIVLSIFLLITAFLYQTNPAFHYGTAGFGPSRHIVFLTPFLIFMILDLLAQVKRRIGYGVLAIYILTQSLILSMNGWLAPDFTNSLKHTPIATYVLTHAPTLYTPLPEIFVDRTNGDDADHPTSAIYKTNGKCTKAYVLPLDLPKLLGECTENSMHTTGSIYDERKDGIYITYE